MEKVQLITIFCQILKTPDSNITILIKIKINFGQVKRVYFHTSLRTSIVTYHNNFTGITILTH